MKKSKKALLWTIVPVLGVSSGVAGAVAGVTNQKTSVDTNNVATSSTATTMATKSTSGVASELKLTVQPYDVLAYSGDSGASMRVWVEGQTKLSNLKYVWKVNKGNGEGWQVHTSGGWRETLITVPKTETLLNWTFKCEIEDITTGWKTVSKEAKFTVAPSNGRNIRITKQPEPNKTVSGGEKVTLVTSAQAVNSDWGKEIGYQWFEFDSENDKFTLIEGATESTYTFTAPYYSKTQPKKYVCKYYFTDNKDKYLSESDQSIVTINKSEEEKITLSDLKASRTSIKVGEKTTLSVKAKSNITEDKDLTYQWYKVGSDDLTFEPIKGATEATYEYTAVQSDDNKALIFCVLVAGSVRDDLLYHFQSKNLEVNVGLSSETTGSIDSETLASTLKVSSSVTTNQATVRESTFSLVRGIKAPEYTVNVEGASGLTYKWYYVSGNNKQLISGADKNVLTTNRSLYEAVYKANDKHRVGIMCEIYQGSKLVKVVDEKTNSRFYMTVITRR